MTSNGFLNRRSRVRLTPGTPLSSNKNNGLDDGNYAHETRTSPRPTVNTDTKDGTVYSPSVRGAYKCQCVEKCLRRSGRLKRCASHLASFKKPSITVPMPKEIDVVRFWAKVEQRAPNECWPWIGGTSGFGYGRYRVGKKLFSAHRVAYATAKGTLSAGEGYHGAVVMHSCDNPACCNPAHLSLGTHLDNVRDMTAKGRNFMPNARPSP